jgi:hypothetical protein
MRPGTLSAPLLLALALESALSGCADASGRFQQFEDRRVALEGDAGAPSGGEGAGGAGVEGGCKPPAPGVVHGLALLALETSALPGAAILFFGEIETPELDGTTAVHYSYKALDATDRRTQVGAPLEVGPFALADDGHFDAETAESTLPGNANAILPGVEITSVLTLHGTICGVSDFYCGTVTGDVSSPIAGPTTGQFGLLMVPSIDDIPARPRFGCSEKALAPALSESRD